MFKKLDRNGDGFISLDEWMASPLAKADKAKAKKIFAGADTDDDGKVSLEEYKVYYEKTDKNRAAKGN